MAPDTAEELLVKLRAGKELQPLSLDSQPEIQQLLKAADVEASSPSSGGLAPSAPSSMVSVTLIS